MTKKSMTEKREEPPMLIPISTSFFPHLFVINLFVFLFFLSDVPE